jgi:hypothetical protein
MADAPNRKRNPRDVAKLASAYLARSRGDAVLALQEAIVDALDEQWEAEKREVAKEGCISSGYVRAGFPTRR